VWRRAWPAFFAEQDCERLLRGLVEAGVTVTRVASIPETLYENRENVNFRRYPGNRYIFPWYGTLPDTEIYRVDWESTLQSDLRQAQARFERGDIAGAIDGYERYLRQRPDDVKVLTDLAIAQMAGGRTAPGLNTFRMTARMAPDNWAVRRNAANAMFDAGLIEEAYDHAQAAAALRPDDSGAAELLQKIVERLRRRPGPV
jgi:Flp pilus assembly protein TadD